MSNTGQIINETVARRNLGQMLGGRWEGEEKIKGERVEKDNFLKNR